ncbi:MAG: glycosyltransferase [Dermatophilaceae bacterium]
MLGTTVASLILDARPGQQPTAILAALAAQTCAPARVTVATSLAAGLRAALDEPCDAVWIMDARWLPEATALETLLRLRRGYAADRPRMSPPVLVAGRVAGDPHPRGGLTDHKSWASRGERAAAARVDAWPLRRTRLRSALIDADRARQIGDPLDDLSASARDREYTSRLVRGRRGLLSRDVVATRALPDDTTPRQQDVAAAIRDEVWSLRASPGLTRVERTLVAVTSTAAWLGSLLPPSDGSTLSATCRGIRQGFAPPPAAFGSLPPLSGPGAAPPSALDPTLPRRTKPRRDDGFSVLLPFYRADSPEALAMAFASVTERQTVRPSQVVLVQDGPVTDALETCVRQLVSESVVPVEHVRLPHNVGLGPALTHGLAACDYDVVARMDADDVSLPTRFEAQLRLMHEGADVVGASLEEFDGSPDHVVGLRQALTDPDEIVARARFEQTFNHPTIVYRASLVEASGGYQNLPLMEDYLLFANLIQHGARVANVGEPLLRYRVSDGAFARRGGLPLLRAELEVQRRFLASGFTTPLQAARNIALRGGYRVTPEPVRRTAYRTYHALRSRRMPASPTSEKR